MEEAAVPRDDSSAPGDGGRLVALRSAILGRGEPLVTVAFVVAVLAFGVTYIGSHWVALTDVVRTASMGDVVAAFAFGLAGQAAAMLGFAALLQAETESTIPKLVAARAFYLTQLGKYIPGSVWPVIAMANAARRLGLRRMAGARAVVLSLVVSVGIGLGFGGSLVMFAMLDPEWFLVPATVALLLVGAVARPDVAIGIARRITPKLIPQHFAHTNHLRAVIVWPLVTWLMLGLQCWWLVVGLGGPGAESVLAAVGGFTLAYVAGVVVVIAPSGLGVREAVLAAILVATLGTGFDHERAVVVVLASRVLLAIVDFTLAGVVVAVIAVVPGRHRGPR